MVTGMVQVHPCCHTDSDNKPSAFAPTILCREVTESDADIGESVDGLDGTYVGAVIWHVHCYDSDLTSTFEEDEGLFHVKLIDHLRCGNILKLLLSCHIGQHISRGLVRS